MLDNLGSRLAVFGFTARMGLADTLGGAWALARFSDRPLSIAPRRKQVEVIASLPVEGLRLEAEAVTLLKRLGLKRIGQLSNLPRASLKRRFPSRKAAQAVLTRLDQALGTVREPLKLLTSPPYHMARLAFTEPLISNEGFEAVLKKLAHNLCAQLARALSGARIIALTAYRSDGSHTALRSGLAAPCRAPDHMLRLLRERIQEIDVGDGVDAITLAALAVEHLPAAQTFFAEKNDKPSATALIDRLSNRLTAARVYHAVPHASHIPERAEIYRPAMRSDSARTSSRSARTAPPRPPLLLERPEPIEVLAEVPEGPPVRFTWRRVTHRIRRWQGPERIAPEWWNDFLTAHGNSICSADGPPRGQPDRLAAVRPCLAPLGFKKGRTRNYYRIEDEAGFLYWVFRAGLYGREEEASSSEAAPREGEGLPRWYLHGVMG